jgi:hypothetical protein
MSIGEHLNQALEHFRLARVQHIDVLEGLQRIGTLSEQALANPRSAPSLLRQITATAANTADLQEDAAGGFSLARISIEKARDCVRQAAQLEDRS